MINIDGKLKIIDILRQYDIRVGGIDSYSTFHVLKTDKGTKILKVWEDQNKLKEIHYYKELLVKEGFRKIERFIPTREGKPYIVADNLVYTLSDSIEGLISDVKREMDMQVVGTTLGEFHLSISKIKTDKPFQNWSNYFERGQLNLDKTELKLTRLKKKRELDEQIIESLSIIKKQVSQSIQMAKHAEKVCLKNLATPILCHGNLSNKSFIIDEYGEGWLTDFTTPVVDMPAYDLGKLIIKVYEKSNFNIKSITAILDYYQDVRPINKEGKLLILTYIAYPHDIWKFLYAYSSGRVARNNDLAKEYEQLLAAQINFGKLYQEIFKYFNL